MTFEQGKILERFAIDGPDGPEEIVFRFPRRDDAASAMDYINGLADESAYLNNLTKVTLEDEEAWLEELLVQCGEGKIVCVAVESRGEYAGAAEARIGGGERAHTANIGIALRRRLRNKGVGPRLMQCVMDLARKHCGVELFWLETFSANEHARHLYEKLGFNAAGALPRFLKRGGRYFDITHMYKQI